MTIFEMHAIYMYLYGFDDFKKDLFLFEIQIGIKRESILSQIKQRIEPGIIKRSSGFSTVLCDFFLKNPFTH